jgi:hypothetical protein
LAGNETCVDCGAGQYMSGEGAVNCLDCNPVSVYNSSATIAVVQHCGQRILFVLALSKNL